MHAYAAKDPVFVALNQRGQRETDGALGDACVQCHAPVALAAGLTTDGTNLADLPDHLGGVTCAWCHRVDAVTGDHNAALSVDADSAASTTRPRTSPTTRPGRRCTTATTRRRPASAAAATTWCCRTASTSNGRTPSGAGACSPAAGWRASRAGIATCRGARVKPRSTGPIATFTTI